MIIEWDGNNTYCVSDYCSEIEEEGVEVIGIGRFQRSSYNSDSVDEQLITTDSQFPQCVEQRISSVSKADENIQLLFYRPPNGNNGKWNKIVD